MPERPGILFGGSLVLDHLKEIDQYPAKGRLSVIRSVSRATGGLACNNPINLKTLDPSLRVATMGRIGDDAGGRYLLSELEDRGVETWGVLPTPGVQTSFTDVMSAKKDGSRTFFCCYGACARWDYEDIPFERCADGFGYAQLGYALILERLDAEDADYGTRLARALARLRTSGLRTAVDVVSEQGERFRRIVAPLLPQVDDFIVNEIEAAAVAGIPERSGDGRLEVQALEEAARRLLEMGVSRTVVIHAPEGALWLEPGAEAIWQPSHLVEPAEIASSVGAGDAFCSGIIYGLHNAWSPHETLRLATAMAGLNLFSHTTTGGAKPLGETLRFAATRPYRKFP